MRIALYIIGGLFVWAFSGFFIGGFLLSIVDLVLHNTPIKESLYEYLTDETVDDMPSMTFVATIMGPITVAVSIFIIVYGFLKRFIFEPIRKCCIKALEPKKEEKRNRIW